MPTFKPKNTKNLIICKKTTTTLDSKHKETVAQFQKDTKERLPLLQSEEIAISDKLKSYHRLPIEERLGLNDRLQTVQKEIKTLQTK